MRQTNGFMLVSGPRNGKRIVLDAAYMQLVVAKPQGMPLAWMDPDAEPSSRLETIEYVPVRGIPGVLAPRGTPPELVVDMLVEGYKP